jgi:Mn2+/Fe2+ NRAMP family transporter
MEKRVFRNLSRNNDSFLFAFWVLVWNTILFFLFFSKIVDALAYSGISYILLLLIFFIPLLFLLIKKYFSGYSIDDEGITAFTIKGKKKHRKWQGIIKVGTFGEEITKNNFPHHNSLANNSILNTKRIYLSPFFPRDNGEYLLTHPDVFIFNYREDLYTLVVEKVKQHNPETQDTYSA